MLRSNHYYKEFGDVFKDPAELPPKRKIDHAIALLDETKVVNQRPYRLPFHQKNAMEELIKHLLTSNMIRPFSCDSGKEEGWHMEIVCGLQAVELKHNQEQISYSHN